MDLAKENTIECLPVKKFHLFTTDSDLSTEWQKAVYSQLQQQINNGMVFLDGKIKYDGLK